MKPTTIEHKINDNLRDSQILKGMPRFEQVSSTANRSMALMAGRLVLALIVASYCLCVASSGHHHNQQHHHQHHHQYPQHHQQSPQHQQQYPQHNQQYDQHQPQQHSPSSQPPPAYSHNPQAHEHNGIAPPQQPYQQAAPGSSNSGKMLASGALLGAASAAAGAATAAALIPHHQNHEQQAQQAGLDQQDLVRPTRHLAAVQRSFVDLSHPLFNGTLHWPNLADVSYNVTTDAEFNNTQGRPYYLKIDNLNAAIHSGTHMDAPRHFSKTGWSVDEIPLHRLIDVPLTVIDVSAKVKANRSYNFVRADFLNPNTSEPLVQSNSVVLVYTGISELYDQGKEAYLGTASNNLNEMKIPGFSEDAANFMVERGVYGVGLDSISADSSDRHGSEGLQSYDPVAHTILNSRNIYILENVSKKLADLVNVEGARLTVAPLPITGGSGSQVRLVAILGHDECHCEAEPQVKNAAGNAYQYSSLTALISLILCSVVLLV